MYTLLYACTKRSAGESEIFGLIRSARPSELSQKLLGMEQNEKIQCAELFSFDDENVL